MKDKLGICKKKNKKLNKEKQKLNTLLKLYKKSNIANTLYNQNLTQRIHYLGNYISNWTNNLSSNLSYTNNKITSLEDLVKISEKMVRKELPNINLNVSGNLNEISEEVNKNIKIMSGGNPYFKKVNTIHNLFNMIGGAVVIEPLTQISYMESLLQEATIKFNDQDKNLKYINFRIETLKKELEINIFEKNRIFKVVANVEWLINKLHEKVDEVDNSDLIEDLHLAQLEKQKISERLAGLTDLSVQLKKISDEHKATGENIMRNISDYYKLAAQNYHEIDKVESIIDKGIDRTKETGLDHYLNSKNLGFSKLEKLEVTKSVIEMLRQFTKSDDKNITGLRESLEKKTSESSGIPNFNKKVQPEILALVKSIKVIF